MLFVPAPFISTSSFSAEATALFARMTTPPSSQRKTDINTLIVALKTASIWSKIDVLHVYAAADSQAALLNWKGNVYNGTTTGTMTFITDRGFHSGGTAGTNTNYINTNFNPTSASSPAYAQDSAHLAYWLQSTSTTNNASTINDQTGGSGGVEFNIRLTSTKTIARVNDSGSAATQISNASAGSAGLYTASRTSSALTTLYQNNSSVGTHTEASGGKPNVNLRVGAGSSAATQPVAAITIGGSLNGTEATSLYNALQAYMTAVGA